MHEPSIYIIVLTYNQYAFTEACLHSLLLVEGSNHKVILVDNGSSDGTPGKVINTFGSNIVVIQNDTNLGFAAGNNVGIRYAIEMGADFVMLLNNDTVVRPDFLKPLMNVLDSQPAAIAVTPKIYFLRNDQNPKLWAAGGKIHLWSGMVENRGRGSFDNNQFGTIQEIDFASGCCILIKTQHLIEIGLLNDDFFAYYEDVDWCLRAKKKGWKIFYVPGSIIWHAAGVSSNRGKNINGAKNPLVHYLVARNHLWFLRRYTNTLQFATALAVYLLMNLLLPSMALIILLRWNKVIKLWQGFRDGLLTSPTSW